METGAIDEILGKLCNDRDITKEELNLVEKYIELGVSLIEHLNKQNEDWRESGINLREISGDGFARMDIARLGPEKWLDSRAEKISKWRKDLDKIKSKIKEIKK